MIEDTHLSQRLEAWPFLVGRNAILDYRPILVPGFLSNDSGKIQDTASIDHDSSSFKTDYISDKKYGNLTFVYRSVPAEENGEILVDAYNRPIYLVEGFVVKNKHVKIEEAQQFFQKVEPTINRAFRKFWGLTEAPHATVSEPCFMNVTATEIKNVAPDRHETARAPTLYTEVPPTTSKATSNYKFRYIAVIGIIALAMYIIPVSDNIELAADNKSKVEKVHFNAFNKILVKNNKQLTETIKLSKLLKINACQNLACPYHILISPLNLQQTLSISDNLISIYLGSIAQQLEKSENLQRFSKIVDNAWFTNLNSENQILDKLAGINTLYIITLTYISNKEEKSGQWQLEFYDLINGKTNIDKSEYFPSGDKGKMIEMLVAVSRELGSKLRIDI